MIISYGFMLCLATLVITTAAGLSGTIEDAMKKTSKRSIGPKLVTPEEALARIQGKRSIGPVEDAVAKAKGKRSIDAGKESVVKTRQVYGGPMGGLPVDVNGMAAMPVAAPSVVVQGYQGPPANSFGALGGLFSTLFG